MGLLRFTLRARLTVISAAGLAIGLLAGGLLIVYVLHLVLIDSLDAGSRQTARDVSALVTSSELPEPIPLAGSQIVQVIDPAGQVVGATESDDRLVPVLNAAERKRALSGRAVVVSGAPFANGTLRVVAIKAYDPDRDNDGDGGERVILVASSTHEVEEATAAVRNALLLSYPLLLAVLTALAWYVVGATLRPVEALRSGAEQISTDGGVASDMLPVPSGGDEVHRLAVTLNDMLGRIDAGRQRERAFVADAAHELRSPIASLRTQLEVADRLNEPAPTADLLADVARLGRLVDDLLLLARTDEGDPRLRNIEEVDVSDLARCAAEGFGNGRVPVRVDPGERWHALGEPSALRRVLDNLIGNAVRHATTQVTVSVAGTDPPERVTVTVADDGPGIPAADRERVFNRFTRLDNARGRDDGGAGLGLAIVRELVRAHHGTITLGDADPGLLVTVVLPAPPAPASASAEA